MDLYKSKRRSEDLARAEKYAKIISKTIILAGSAPGSFGQNAFFYDSAEGILTASILLVAQYAKSETRHIVSVYKLIQDLVEPGDKKGFNRFQELMGYLPPDSKIRMFAGAALTSSEVTMASVMSTALSRLSTFLDSELETILCGTSTLDAERLSKGKCAMFIIMPEEDNTKYFMVSLLIQELYRELLSLADECGGKLPRRVIFYCDEFGTLPRIESAEIMFSASRSRGISFVPIIQSFAQLECNYGKEGAEIIVDNVQLTIFGGFAPNSNSAKMLSQSMGSSTVQAGSVNCSEKGSMSLSMIERPLMTADELKLLPKGTFIAEKTGYPPIRMKLKLFYGWGITFETPFQMPFRDVNTQYVNWFDIKKAIRDEHEPSKAPVIQYAHKTFKEPNVPYKNNY